MILAILSAAVIVGGVAFLVWVANEDWKIDIDVTQKEIDDQLTQRSK